MRDALSPGTRVQDHVIEQWLRAVPDGHLYRVSHVESGQQGTLHEYLPRSWSVREGEMVVALTGRGPEFRAGLQRFLLRARQLKQVEHPALPTVTDLWSCNGTAYTLFPAFTGQSLAEVVADQGGALQLSTAWPWLATCCELAERLHAQGRIHGAWDPSAIWVLSDRKLVLPAPEVDGGSQQPSPWVALEQTVLAPGRAQRGPWTDVFGIGALAGFMLTGLNPTMLSRQLGSQRQGMNEPHAGDSGFDQDAQLQTGKLLMAIRASLSPNPRERPQDIAQFREMIGLLPQAPVHRHLQVLAPKSGEVQAGPGSATTTRAVRPGRPAAPLRAGRAAAPGTVPVPSSRSPAQPVPTPTPPNPELAEAAGAASPAVEPPAADLPTSPAHGDLTKPAAPLRGDTPSSNAPATPAEVPSDRADSPDSGARTGGKGTRLPPLKMRSPGGKRASAGPDSEPAPIRFPPEKVPLPVPYRGEPPAADATDYPVVTTVLSGLPATVGSGADAAGSGQTAPSGQPRPARKTANPEVWLALAAAVVVAMLWFFVDAPRMPELASAPPPAAVDRPAQLDRLLERDPPAAGPAAAAVAGAAVATAPALANAAPADPAPAPAAPPAAEPVQMAAKPAADPPADAAPAAAGPAPAPAARAPRLPRCTQALLEQSLGSGGAAAQVSRACR